RRAEARDPRLVERLDGREHLRLGGAAQAGVEEAPEGDLVGAVLVDVRDAQLRLPEEGVVGAVEDLALLCDRVGPRLQSRAAVGVAEGVGPDLLDHGLEAASDRAEVLDALLPQGPGPVGAARVVAPGPDAVPDPGRVRQGGFGRSRSRPSPASARHT
ncbi:hypothetical protein VWQ21_22610, partial [Xanthomonas citri pv. citri]